LAVVARLRTQFIQSLGLATGHGRWRRC
jgi:hypothetical protein